MKVWIGLIVFFSFFSAAFGQGLYLRTFGDSTNGALIFLHGGPGYNSASFEATTAQILADEGFYVIVYDRRGEGRSSNVSADFTFDESIQDLNFIYDSLNLSTAALVGHSFGGIVATKFATAEKAKVKALVMLSAPVNLQVTFKTILHSCALIHSQQKDVQSWAYVNALAKTDSTSIAYSSECFSLAMRNGFYSPKKPSKAARKIIQQFESNTALYQTASKLEKAGPLGFMRNENYTSIDLTEELNALVKNKVKIYGLYGQEDGLYSPAQIDELTGIIGKDNMAYLSKCSHNPFIDQQVLFLKHMLTWCK
ncbi:MAG: alpha/beta fold hydrolase [Crocinitomix sp.]|nr:alpha/beta fold hydrolase [Crocinitomix sp.]